MEKYNSAVNTFRTKYNGIPGDLLNAQLARLAFAPRRGAMLRVEHKVSVTATASFRTLLLRPRACLSASPCSFGLFVDGQPGRRLARHQPDQRLRHRRVTLTTAAKYLPAAKLGRGNYWSVGNNGAGTNFYMLGVVNSNFAGGANGFAVGLTPIESYNIDVKLDDGGPNSGIVQARTADGATSFGELVAGDAGTNGAATASTCTTGGATAMDPAATYNRGTVAAGPGISL